MTKKYHNKADLVRSLWYSPAYMRAAVIAAEASTAGSAAADGKTGSALSLNTDMLAAEQPHDKYTDYDI